MLTLFSLLFAAKLAATGSIDATVRGTKEPVNVALLRRDDAGAWHEQATRHLPAAERHARFRGLAAGIYQIRVRGTAPFEQSAAKVAVGEGEARSAVIDVDPVELFGRATLGDIPLGHAAILLKQRQFQWQAAMEADENGLFHARLWQHGAFNCYVRSAALGTTYGDEVTVDGPSPFRWELRLPDRRLAGVVRDRVTGSPIAGASLHLQTKSAAHERNATAHTDANGRFDVTAMTPGVVTIIASADRYLDALPAPFTLAEADRVHEIAVDMEPGVVVPVTIRDTAGQPLAGADVLTATGGNLRGRAVTGGDGVARVTLPPNTSATMYVVPHEGSFAAVRVADAAHAQRRITLPRPSSTLRIVTRTTAGKALPNVNLLMRVDGELIPPAVAEAMQALQDLTLQTDDRGEAVLRRLPPGAYEFWPYSSQAEAEAIVETAGSLLAPIVVNVKTGENTIAVNFRAR
jgi:hypothetical protein